MELLQDIHNGLERPRKEKLLLISGRYDYYHYMVDGTEDIGWGCGYRTLQTMCSWIKLSTTCPKINESVPSLRRIQEILVEAGDKPTSFVNSRDWIGSCEVFLVLDVLFDVPCKIVHLEPGRFTRGETGFLVDHFMKFKSPVMMGGDVDGASKCIIGISYCSKETPDNMMLLILDPHFSGSQPTKCQLQKNGWVSWQRLSNFCNDSFYNFCLPQISSSN